MNRVVATACGVVAVDWPGLRPARAPAMMGFAGFRRRVARRKAKRLDHPSNGTDGGGERRDVVEHVERNEVVGPAGIVLAALAGADQDAVI
ncbi:hypothetical protein [Mesorhizobium sp. M0220]|uniref:hypothetical protein n=1 Tax=unclassified Mesorhizobium TaxID=325217 RepID=UPI003338C3DF